MPAHSLLVTDFDGTMTARDFYELVIEDLAGPGSDRFWTAYERGEITHFDALRLLFESVEAPESRWLALVDRMQLDPGAASAIARLRSAGWEIAIASAGSSWYIDRLLGEAGIRGTVHANGGRFERGRLEMLRPEGSPFADTDAGIDKAAVVLDAKMRYATVAFAGNGPPDLAPALEVPPALRFARGTLARLLDERGESYRSYGVWSEIADMLLAPTQAS